MIRYVNVYCDAFYPQEWQMCGPIHKTRESAEGESQYLMAACHYKTLYRIKVRFKSFVEATARA